MKPDRRKPKPRPVVENLPNPEVCKFCGQRGQVLQTRSRSGFRWRRWQCTTCRHGDGHSHKWSSFETLIDPRRIRSRDPARAGT